MPAEPAVRGRMSMLIPYDSIRSKVSRDVGLYFAAERALAIEHALNLLAFSPFSCRKAQLQKSPRWRELLILFGHSGYVALFEIEDENTVTVTALRHQREEDYH